MLNTPNCLAVSKIMLTFASDLETNSINNQKTIDNMKVMQRIIESMPKRIANDLRKNHLYNTEVFEMVLAAYNRYCEDEKDGIDYIYDIYNQEDLKTLVNNGMTANDITKLFESAQYTKSNYFFCDCNHDIEQIASFEHVLDFLIGMIDEVCEYVMTYVTRCEEYQSVYEKYVTDTYLEYKDAEALRDKTKLGQICVRIDYTPSEDIDALAALKKKLEEMS
jgi:hypothetical protein